MKKYRCRRCKERKFLEQMHSWRTIEKQKHPICKECYNTVFQRGKHQGFHKIEFLVNRQQAKPKKKTLTRRWSRLRF